MALSPYDFVPIQKQSLIDLVKMFSSSNIIKPDHVTVDFITEIMPANTQVMKAEKLYQHSAIMKDIKSKMTKWDREQAQLVKKAQREGKTIAESQCLLPDAPQRFH